MKLLSKLYMLEEGSDECTNIHIWEHKMLDLVC
jgi:hypothetical protein